MACAAYAGHAPSSHITCTHDYIHLSSQAVTVETFNPV